MLLALSALFLMTASLPLLPPAEAATVPYTLWGSTAGGWGFTSGSETNPGPTLTATEGDTIELTLEKDDTAPHFWLLDYDGDNVADPGEPLSGAIPTFFSFIADTPGTFTYRCSIHTSSMIGTFVISPANQAPVVSISQPDGTQSWTGGTSHDVVWTMTDPETAVTGLTAWVNYSYAAGANTGTIAGPVTGSTNPHTVSWAVPAVDATDMTVEVTVADADGASTLTTATVPVVDSTPPQVLSTLPTDGAIDVPLGTALDVTFDEPMDQPLTEAAIALFELPAWTPVALNVVGWTGDTVTLQPAAILASNTMYSGNVTTTAEDASDPGNALAVEVSWTFTTLDTTDTTPPVAVITPPGGAIVAGIPATFSGNASSDDSGTLASYAWEIRDSVGTLLTTGSSAWITYAFASAGSYNVTLTVTDPSGNSDTDTLIVTVDPPSLSVSDLQASPDPAEVPADVNLSALVTSTLGVSEVWFDAGSLGNVSGTFDAGTGRYYAVVSIAAPATYDFTVAALDAGGQWVTATASFDGADTTPPTIGHTPPTTLELLTPADLSAAVSDNHALASASVTITDVQGGVTTLPFNVSQASPYPFTIPGQLFAGTVSYRIDAADPSGNAANLSFSVDVTGSLAGIVLYGDTGEGWGFGPQNMSIPGPTLEVREGDTVTVILIGLDAAPHFFYVDLDNDGTADAGEPRSENFLQNSTSLTFTAPAAGNYTYYCGFHPTTMLGTLTVLGEDSEPPPGDGTEPEPVSPLLWVAALLILVVIGVVVAVALRRRRPGAPTEPEADELPVDEERE